MRMNTYFYWLEKIVASLYGVDVPHNFAEWLWRMGGGGVQEGT